MPLLIQTQNIVLHSWNTILYFVFFLILITRLNFSMKYIYIFLMLISILVFELFDYCELLWNTKYFTNISFVSFDSSERDPISLDFITLFFILFPVSCHFTRIQVDLLFVSRKRRFEWKRILAAIKKQGEKESRGWNNKSTSFFWSD